jgi:arylsulfatase
MPINEYPSGKAFSGVVGRTADESMPAWPAPVRAPKGTPNETTAGSSDRRGAARRHKAF